MRLRDQLYEKEMTMRKESNHLDQEVDTTNANAKFVNAVDISTEKEMERHKDLDLKNFNHGYAFLLDKENLGGSIMRPLNSPNARNIKTPFL